MIKYYLHSVLCRNKNINTRQSNVVLAELNLLNTIYFSYIWLTVPDSLIFSHIRRNVYFIYYIKQKCTCIFFIITFNTKHVKQKHNHIKIYKKYVAFHKPGLFKNISNTAACMERQDKIVSFPTLSLVGPHIWAPMLSSSFPSLYCHSSIHMTAAKF